MNEDDSVVVSCLVSNDELDLTQYHVFQNGSSTIYLGTYTVANPAVGELRFIFRLEGLEGAYPTGNVSDTRNGAVIESEDIWEVGGETRAKVRPDEIEQNIFHVYFAHWYLPSTTLPNDSLMTRSIARTAISTRALSSLSGATRHRPVAPSNVISGSTSSKIIIRMSVTT